MKLLIYSQTSKVQDVFCFETARKIYCCHDAKFERFGSTVSCYYQGRMVENLKLLPVFVRKEIVIKTTTAGAASDQNFVKMATYFDGILPKGPYPPCLRMANRALLAVYPRFLLLWVFHCYMECVFLVRGLIYIYQSRRSAIDNTWYLIFVITSTDPFLQNLSVLYFIHSWETHIMIITVTQMTVMACRITGKSSVC